MSVHKITATVDCDNCGKRFTVELDPADKLPEGWSLWDEVEDAVRGGVATGNPMGESTSVQDGKMLCAECTRERDKT